MKYVLILLAAMAFCGCEEPAQNWNDNGRIYKMVDIDSRSDFSIFCDRSTNIAYLRYWVSETKNGFTVYYNSKGEPAHCDEVKKLYMAMTNMLGCDAESLIERRAILLEGYMDYGKLKFEHITGAAYSGVADHLHYAICRLNGGTYFRNDDTRKYDYIPPDRTYKALGAWPAIDGVILIYIEEKYCGTESPDPYKLAYAMYHGTDPDTGIIYKKMQYYELIRYGLCPTWRDAIENNVEECPTPSAGEVEWLPNSEWGV